jgi:hypothetical protein
LANIKRRSGDLNFGVAPKFYLRLTTLFRIILLEKRLAEGNDDLGDVE